MAKLPCVSMLESGIYERLLSLPWCLTEAVGSNYYALSYGKFLDHNAMLDKHILRRPFRFVMAYRMQLHRLAASTECRIFSIAGSNARAEILTKIEGIEPSGHIVKVDL